MDHLLVLLLLLWSSGLLAEGEHTSTESVRLVKGDSRCAGILEVKHQGDWRPVPALYYDYDDYTPMEPTVVACRELDCGSVLSIRKREESSYTDVWRISSDCVQSGSALTECATSDSSLYVLNITCSDSVRLVNGTSQCSGRLEVKSNQSNQSNQRWSSVCEADFDQQDAEVVCRELGCGAPSVLQGALYGEVEAPMWTKEFQCGGHESALLDCRSSGSDRNTCSPGRAVRLTCSESVRLVGGDSRCAGTLELKHQGVWRPAGKDYSDWTLKEAAIFCGELDCGYAVSSVWTEESSHRDVWQTSSNCVLRGSALRECVVSDTSSSILDLTCSDSVRLVDGTSQCSGRLEVRSNQSNQRWSSVCEADFDQQDAEVVCRELGCGAPSVLQGALYGEVEAPMWTKEFQCGGHESALLDCRSSGSDRNTCLPGRAVRLTCSESVRLVGGDSRCAGTLELKHQGEWRPAGGRTIDKTLRTAAAVCRELDCGFAVSEGQRKESSERDVWRIDDYCVGFRFPLRECAISDFYSSILELTCLNSVRLVDGTSLCSGRLEVRSNQSNQSNQRWSSVCEADFDQQDAEVVCRELGCGAPSVLQGALYGEVEAPMWTKEFQCGGHESALLDCRSSGSDRNTCSPGRAVRLTCSEPVRLVGGHSRCAGTLELKHQGEWRPVDDYVWTMKEAAVVCRDLDCGSAVSFGRRESSDRSTWWFSPSCVQGGFALRECASTSSSSSIINLTCSDSVRLVNGTSQCSGRLEVKSNQSNQSNQRWSSVCEADFDQQDAEVVCRELGCGAPSVLQGALYGEVEAPMWTKEFQCGGHESALLDCRSSGSDRNTCSPGRAVRLTCSEPVRLVGGDSRCAGTLELNYQGDWRPVDGLTDDMTMKTAAAACRELNCGSAVSERQSKESSHRDVWKIDIFCVWSGSTLRECVTSGLSSSTRNLICSDLLLQPSISVSSSTDGVSEAQQQGFQVFRGSTFIISCSIQPQYPGGSFQLTFTSSNSTHIYTQPAVNHSAHFLFPAAEPAHQGNYSCVYHIHVFSHDFSSESRLLSVTVSDSTPHTSFLASDPPDPTPFIIRAVVLSLTLVVVNTSLYFYCKASRGQKVGRRENIELD